MVTLPAQDCEPTEYPSSVSYIVKGISIKASPSESADSSVVSLIEKDFYGK